MENISKIILVVTFPLLLVLLAADITIFNQNWYEQKFEQENIYAALDAPKETVREQAQNILNYIQAQEALRPTLLNEKEQLHLRDVQNLVTKGHQLLIVLVLLHITLWIKIKEKRKTLLYASLFTLIILGLFMLFPFEQVFLKFHKLVFTNEFWLLNPATDNLIKIYPQVIFQTLAVKIGAITGMLALVGLAISLYKQKREK